MREVHEIDQLEAFLDREHDLRDCVVQGLDLGEVHVDWESVQLAGAVFLGCRYPSLIFQERLREAGALIFPRLPRLPYNPYRPSLYSREELMEGWTETEDNSVDKRIYDHFMQCGRHRPHILEALAQRLHDHAVDDALLDLLEGRIEEGGEKKVVAIMGGHGTLRTDPYYEKVARIARSLTRRGYFVASGGGPGIMEASNLGAWLANGDDDLLGMALEELAVAPKYSDPGFNAAAVKVIEMHPEGASSLAIPTWFYGHEPSNQFSTYIAKYFSNGLREDGLLAIARHGVVYAPGSAGTTQEVFMDAAQNHYGTFEMISPMAFLGVERYTSTGLYETLMNLSEGKRYRDMLTLSDDPDAIVSFIESHPPVEYATVDSVT